MVQGREIHLLFLWVSHPYPWRDCNLCAKMLSLLGSRNKWEGTSRKIFHQNWHWQPRAAKSTHTGTFILSVPESRPWVGISGDHSIHTSAYCCNSAAAPGVWWQASWGMAFSVSQAMTTECEWVRAAVQRDREQETKNSSQGEEIGGWWDTGWQLKLGFKSLSASFPKTLKI